jgi:hypothetical protein
VPVALFTVCHLRADGPGLLRTLDDFQGRIRRRMPLTGGPTDKAGNSYERRWTVFTLLDLLDGRAQSIRIEVPGDDGIGAEFRVMAGGVPVWHQAKRQRDGGPWTVANIPPPRKLR